MSGEWRKDAACQHPGVDPELFWPKEFAGGGRPATTELARAVHICNSHCPVRSACLRWACDEAVKHRLYPCVAGGKRWVAKTGGSFASGVSDRVEETRRGCPICNREVIG